MKMLIRILVCLAVTLTFAHADALIANAQTKLKRMGFYDGSVDGQMGSQTSAAIRRYQLAQNLKVTGELNSQTVQNLGLTPTPVSKPMPTYVAIADIFKGGPYISIGAEGQIATIRRAQKNLKLLGYYNGPSDGVPSAALVNGLKVWQKSAGFRQTGRFDESTLKGLDLMPN